MITKKQLIEKAYKMPYEQIEKYLNSEYWVFIPSIRDNFPDYEISKEDNHFDGIRFRPAMLYGINDNNGWSPTGYHDGSVKKCPLINGEFYHIGFLNLSGSFSYQGIKEFNDGFFEDGYHLKPFPTHYIKIEKPRGALHL
jgi:hypothetical protein